MTRTERIVLKAAVFTAGALLMALEVSAFRIIGKTFGSALRETTTVIAVFLAAMSAGYWAGGRAGDRRPRATTLVATLAAASITCFLVPWLDAWISPVVSASGLALGTHAFVATSILFAIPTFLFAATSPIAVRLFTTSTGESGSTAGSISAISTTGSIAGSLVTAFFLIDWLASINRTVIFVGLGAAATAAVTALTFLTVRRRVLAVAGAAIALIVLTAAFVRSTSIDRVLLTPLPNTRVVFVGDSPYHHLVVRERARLRELVFNIAIQSRMQIDDPYGPGLFYTDSIHLTRLLRPETKRVLILGVGGGTIAKQFTHFYPDVVVDAVDVDPLVIDVAKRYFAVEPGPRLRLHVADGRTFLKRSRERWDLVIIDAYSTNRYGDTIPPHLVTREFFAEIAERLTPNGVLHFHCAFHGSKLMPALEKTITAVYPSVARVHGELLASRTPLVIEKEVLHARAEASGITHLPNLRDAIDTLALRAAPRDGQLLTDDYAPVDTLLLQQ